MPPTARAISLTLLALSLPVPAAAGQASPEYEVKATFVLNFARYVEWPPKQQTPPFRICVLGSNPFGKRLEAAVEGETWHDGPIVVRRVREVREARNCHLLYVPAADTDRFLSTASEVEGRPVLTVGETARFLSNGGMIYLFIEQNTVRFSINQTSARSAGLQISSRLLRLAREVVNQPSGLE
jgi:YfiR/HmsC-like